MIISMGVGWKDFSGVNAVVDFVQEWTKEFFQGPCPLGIFPVVDFVQGWTKYFFQQ